MLKIVRNTVLILFAAAVILFAYGYYKTKYLVNTDGPVITIEPEQITVSIDDDNTVLLSGITATDKKDGDVTSSIEVQGLSNFVEKGRRILTVAAFDSDNNVTLGQREIVYSDYRSTEFILSRALNFQVGTSEAELLKNLTVTDCLDGNLLGSLVIQTEDPDSYLDEYVPGTCRIVYSCVNSAGDMMEIPATVEYYSSELFKKASRVQLKTYAVRIGKNEAFDPVSMIDHVEIGGEAYPYKKDLVNIENPVQPGKEGVYEVVYTVREPEKEDNSLNVRLIVIVE